MWDGVRPTRGGRAFCGHFLTSHLTHSKYALIDWLSNYIRASEVSDHSGAFPALSCESFHVLPVKIITPKIKKSTIKVEVGPGCGPAGARVGHLLTLLNF